MEKKRKFELQMLDMEFIETNMNLKQYIQILDHWSINYTF